MHCSHLRFIHSFQFNLSFIFSLPLLINIKL
nr:MAG TPA: hypothetical protein [Caudoviricetes sp.]